MPNRETRHNFFMRWLFGCCWSDDHDEIESRSSDVSEHQAPRDELESSPSANPKSPVDAIVVTTEVDVHTDDIPEADGDEQDAAGVTSGTSEPLEDDQMVDETTHLLYLSRAGTGTEERRDETGAHQLKKRVISRIRRSKKGKQPESAGDQWRRERDEELHRRESFRQRLSRVKDAAARKELEADEETRCNYWESVHGTL